MSRDPAQDLVGVGSRRKYRIEHLRDGAVADDQCEPLQQHLAVELEGRQRPSVRQLELPSLNNS